MTESPTEFNKSCLEIPVEIVSDEEMALLEAALASAAAAVRPARFRSGVRSVQSITALSKRGFPSRDKRSQDEPDLEDLGGFRDSKKIRSLDSPLLRFRKKKGLSVTDLTNAEWCEKQMEFFLSNKRRVTKSMERGIARHAVLEEEVKKKVIIQVESHEDRWALRLLNFVTGVNQLLFEGLTRELPIIGYIEGVWMVGVIDEIRLPATESSKSPLLVDTKTRNQPSLPSEPQQRNGRLQLMCYKHIWDNLVAENFPTKKFFDYFSLNPYDTLTQDIIETSDNLGFPVKTLEDMIKYYTNTCSMLPLAHDELLLRYEYQRDNSLLGESQFLHDSIWVKKQIHESFEFWLGEREASFTPEEERWKCWCCQFVNNCGVNANIESDSKLSPKTSDREDIEPSQ